MSGILYIVGTPIGNLGDITFRAVETLKTVDVIACEDTRHTLRLLNYLEIKNPLVSYYKQKEKEGSKTVCQMLEDGKNVALVSDAGMPCISDPGAQLVSDARERGYDVTVVPGPTAVTTAAALCGLQTGFTFVGFLPEKKKEFDKVVSPLVGSPLPLVFYAAPHDLNRTIKSLFCALGSRRFYAVKELTKIYENVSEGILGQTEFDEPKGEYVLIVMPCEQEKRQLSEDDIKEILIEKMKTGADKRAAVKAACEEYGLSKNVVYKISLSL